MDMVPYGAIFRKEAERETRALLCPNNALLPNHSYRLLEHFCVERECNCRRVSIWVFDEQTRKFPAIIEHNLSYVGDSRRRSRTALDPFGVDDGPAALALLAEFRKMLDLDSSYEERLARIYESWRPIVDDPSHRLHPLVRSYWASTARPHADRRQRGARFDFVRPWV